MPEQNDSHFADDIFKCIFLQEDLHTSIPIPMKLTLKHREMHGCVVSTVATDALVLKHQAIIIHNAD